MIVHRSPKTMAGLPSTMSVGLMLTSFNCDSCKSLKSTSSTNKAHSRTALLPNNNTNLFRFKKLEDDLDVAHVVDPLQPSAWLSVLRIKNKTRSEWCFRQTRVGTINNMSRSYCWTSTDREFDSPAAQLLYGKVFLLYEKWQCLREMTYAKAQWQQN